MGIKRFVFALNQFVLFSDRLHLHRFQEVHTNIRLGMKKVIRLLGKIGQADPMIWGYVMLH